MKREELERFTELMNEMTRIICESFTIETETEGEYVNIEGERAYKVGAFITYD